MATITSRKVVQEILDGDGVYPGDPPAARVYEYWSMLGEKVVWAVFYEGDNDDIAFSPLVEYPVLLWDQMQGHVNKIGAVERLLVTPTPHRRSPPSVEQLMAWEAEGFCEATDGCVVEPDGHCPHGCPSWLLEMGLI